MKGAQPWGGLVPNVPVVHDAGEQLAAATAPPGSPPAAPAPPTPPPSDAAAQLLEQQAIRRHIDALEQWLRRSQTPAQITPFTFDGAANPARLRIRDDHPPYALSYGIINPTAAKVYLGIAGEAAAPNNNAYVVGPTQAVVLPIAVEQIEVGIDPTDLGANQATIFRLRFLTVQPFFLGSVQ